MTEVTGPIHINRILRAAGLIRIKPELGREMLDPGASEAFAVADHQIAHVYVKDPARIPEVRTLLEAVDGIEMVLDEEGKRAHGLDHPRSGELVAVSRPERWFSYYFWFDNDRAPDYARTVDIHRKPGYDPAELFVDPGIRMPTLKVGATLAKKKLVPAGPGTLPTHSPLFVCFLAAVVVVVGALAFIPALALGPIAEHLMAAGS